MYTNVKYGIPTKTGNMIEPAESLRDFPRKKINNCPKVRLVSYTQCLRKKKVGPVVNFMNETARNEWTEV